ncbi:MAG TPA: ribonuclease P protein component [Gammaproteobacteria bacterium]|nr:ribonuclease P protein component [Gammaproteobacteria bacterium]
MLGELKGVPDCLPEKRVPGQHHGFEKSQRLLKPTAFRQVLRQHHQTRSRSFTISTAVNQQGHARLGIAVSRKVSKRAVVRNRIKRQIRETFRCHHVTSVALDIVLIAKPAAALRKVELRKELATLWQNLLNYPVKHC